MQQEVYARFAPLQLQVYSKIREIYIRDVVFASWMAATKGVATTKESGK